MPDRVGDYPQHDARTGERLVGIVAASTEVGMQRDRANAAEAERDELRAALDRVTGSFAMAYKGPEAADASCMREGAKRLEGGYEVGGSNMRAATARLLRAVADELDRAIVSPALSGHCSSCHRPLPHNETEQAACTATGTGATG